MTSHLTGIDHAIVGVNDLDQAKVAFEALGFRVTPKGRHVGWGTANHCVMFRDDYVELLGIVDPQQFTNDLDRFLKRGEGILSVALAATDPEAIRKVWHTADLDPADVKDLGRKLEPDILLKFRNVMLKPEATAGVSMFATTPLTPEAMRQPDWLDHPNGVIGIGAITIVTKDPGSFVEPMSRIFGAPCLTETDDTLAIHTGRGVLLIATPDDLDMLHPQFKITAWDHEEPRLAVLSLRVRDLESTAAWLRKAGIPYQRDAGGTIGVAPEHARGVLLEFTR